MRKIKMMVGMVIPLLGLASWRKPDITDSCGELKRCGNYC